MSTAASFPQRAPATGWRQWTVAQWFCALVRALLVIRGVSVFVTGPSFGLPGAGGPAGFHLRRGAVLLALLGRRRRRSRVAIGCGVAWRTVTVPRHMYRRQGVRCLSAA